MHGEWLCINYEESLSTYTILHKIAQGTQISEAVHNAGIQTQHDEHFVFQGTCQKSSELSERAFYWIKLSEGFDTAVLNSSS